jgi:hypothetical protein
LVTLRDSSAIPPTDERLERVRREMRTELTLIQVHRKEETSISADI